MAQGLHSLPQTLSVGPFLLCHQAKSVDELEKLWAEYFVVTFVRNPYQRAVSSYKMMMRQLALGSTGSASYSWDKFCADPTGFADECMQDEMCKK